MPTRRSLKDTQPRKPKVATRAQEKPASSTREPASVSAALNRQYANQAEALSAKAPLEEAAPSCDEIDEQGAKQKPSETKSARGGRKSVRGKRASRRASRNADSGAEHDAATQKRGARKQKRSAARIALAVVGGVFVALVVVCIAFSFDRWYAHDDAQDIQGTWYIYGTDVSIPISQDVIELSDDAEYRYTIDTQAKTITYSIGNLSGTSHYRFSNDRSCVALIEDGKKVFTATLLDDVSWWFSSLGTALSGNVVLPGPLQSNVVMLTRVPYTEQVAQQQSQGADEGDANPNAESSVSPDGEANANTLENAGGGADAGASADADTDASAEGVLSSASSEDMSENAQINDAGAGANVGTSVDTGTDARGQ